MRSDKMTELSNVHYLCSWCGRGFKSKSGYYGHIRTHGLNKDAPYKCCGKRFFSLANWNRHRCNRHGEMGKFQCEKCKKRYPSQADLNRHGMLVHSNPEYQCNICGAKFMIKDRLDQHRDTHTGEKRFRCSKCFKPYRHDSNLYKHQKTCSG
ncbi:zinc finger protein 577-like [Argopecten irradians]|uniref:zinc finger protein 577-like n=1 Tax=Argopecten irradians TaxID=31199 RepID=UPI0037107D9B